MKKKILALLLVICMIMPILSGCSLIFENSYKTNYEVVAHVGDKVITKTELSNAYSEYYNSMNQYYQYYGYSEMDQQVAFDYVYRQLVNQKLLLIEAEKVVKLTNSEKNKVWQQVFDYIDDMLNQYEVQIRKIQGEEVPPELEEDKKEDTTLFKPNEYDFEKDTEIKFVQYLADRKIVGAEETLYNDEALLSYKNYTYDTNNPYRVKAYNYYLSSLVKSERLSGNKLTTTQALIKDMQRIYNVYAESKLVEEYQLFLYGKLAENGSAVTDEKIITEYKKLLQTNKDAFATEGAYASTMSSLKEYVYYNDYEGIGNGYFSVQHILVTFPEEVITALMAYPGYDSSKFDEIYIKEFEKKLKEAGEMEELSISYKDYETGETEKDENDDDKKKTLAEIFAEIAVQVLGIDETNTAKISEIADLLNESGVAEVVASDTVDLKTKAQKFYEFVFKYGSDTGFVDSSSISSWTGYYLPMDDTVSNSFHKNFSAAAYKLYDNYLSNGTYGITTCTTLGSNSGTNFGGVHILMFNGVTSPGAVVPVTGDNETDIAGLKAHYLSGFANKTVYEYIYESIINETKTNMYNSLTTSLYDDYLNKGKIKFVKSTFEQIIG